MPNWKTLGSKVVYKNKWLQLREDSVITPIGSKGIYSVLELASDFLYIAAANNQNEFYLIRQYRYPVKQITWEFPAGQTDGENPIVAAKRELLEEIGTVARKLTKIGEVFADTGVYSTKGHIFIAQDAGKVTDELDSFDGILEVKAFSVEKIHNMIINGDIQCPHTISTFYLAKSYTERQAYDKTRI